MLLGQKPEHQLAFYFAAHRRPVSSLSGDKEGGESTRKGKEQGNSKDTPPKNCSNLLLNYTNDVWFISLWGLKINLNEVRFVVFLLGLQACLYCVLLSWPQFLVSIFVCDMKGIGLSGAWLNIFCRSFVVLSLQQSADSAVEATPMSSGELFTCSKRWGKVLILNEHMVEKERQLIQHMFPTDTLCYADVNLL